MAMYDGETPSEPLLVVEGFSAIAIAPAIEVSPSESFELAKLATTQWKRDVSFLTAAQQKKELTTPIDAAEADVMGSLTRATFYYIHDAVSQLTDEDVAQMEWYHAKYYEWMKLQLAQASENLLGPESATWSLDSASTKASVIDQVRQETVNGEMVCCLGPQIVSILRRRVTPLEAMMENDLLHRYYENAIKWERTTRKLGRVAQDMAYKQPRMKILEIGAGTGGATKRILDAIGHQAALYDFTDISSGFFEEARKVFSANSDMMQFKRLDIEQDPVAQGFEEGTYDLVIACQVLHATKNMHNTMVNVKHLMKPGARLLLMETTNDALDLLFAFGLLPGWWLSEEPERQWSPSLSIDMWNRVLTDTGFGGIDFEVHDCDDDRFYSFSVISATIPEKHADILAPENSTATIVTERNTTWSQEWLAQFQAALDERTGGLQSIQTLGEADLSGKTCVFVENRHGQILSDPSESQFADIQSLFAQCRGLIWLTRGAAVEVDAPMSALSIGLLRVARSENMGKRFVHIDLPYDQEMSASEISSVSRIYASVFDYSQPCTDFEYAIRNDEILTPRYFVDDDRVRDLFRPLPESIEQTSLGSFQQPSRPLRLAVGTPGFLDTLHFQDNPAATQVLSEDCIEISPKAFGINFRDVMTAMGQLESNLMGLECAGVVTRVGVKAKDKCSLRPGDRVAALLRGYCATSVTTEWTNVVAVPDSMSFETAASIPLAFTTSYISLVDLASLQAGERVLIHSAAGGVGQAAIILAQHLGAQVFATVGSQAKREFLTSQCGIPDEHIFSSRDSSFARDVMRATGGQGVDVALNCLAGSLLHATLGCIARFGRFVELGKKDLESNNRLDMGIFKHQVTFASLDLLKMEEFQGKRVQQALTALLDLFEAGSVCPIHPIVAYPLSEVEKPFRLMQTGKHMGKFVLTVGADEQVMIARPFKAEVALKPDASYLVVGGLGGIGRSICHWMADQGAKHVVVMSRSAGASSRSKEVEAEMSRLGVTLACVSCDVSDEAALAAAASDLGARLPPVRGVIQAAMVLHDIVFEQMSQEAWNAAVRPKVHASLNLHRLFTDVDFFIMLSSLSGVTGFVSQSNYAAGNTFQDALARHRLSQGLHGAAIDIGIVNSVGYLAAHKDQMQRLRKAQFHVLSESDVLATIASAILTAPSEQMLLGLNGANLDAPTDARFLSLPWKLKTIQMNTNPGAQNNKDVASAGGTIATALASATTFVEAVGVLQRGIVEKLMDIFMIADEAEISPETRTVADLGVDSLVAVELRNLLALRAGADISVFDIMSSTSVNALARKVASKSSFVLPDCLKAVDNADM